MATSPFFHVLLLPFVFLLLQIPYGFVGVDGDEQFVRDTCAKISVDNKYCESILLANSSSLKADLPGLATISDWALISNMSLGRKGVLEVMQNASGQTRRVLQDCLGCFDEGINCGLQSVSSIASGNFHMANLEIEWTSDSGATCQVLYEEFNLTFPPKLLRQQNIIKDLSDLAVDLVYLKEN